VILSDPKRLSSVESQAGLNSNISIKELQSRLLNQQSGHGEGYLTIIISIQFKKSFPVKEEAGVKRFIQRQFYLTTLVALLLNTDIPMLSEVANQCLTPWIKVDQGEESWRNPHRLHRRRLHRGLMPVAKDVPLLTESNVPLWTESRS
jgi:hypothetical protein